MPAVDRTIELLKQAQERMRAMLADYELAMAKFREGAALIAKHVGEPGALQTPDLTVLSERETEIFKLISKGMESDEIADTIGIAVKTVRAHRDNIRQKLKVDNHYELQRLAKAALGDASQETPTNTEGPTKSGSQT